MVSDSLFEVLSPISTFVEIDECVVNTDAVFSPYIVEGCSQYYKTGSGPTAIYGCLKCGWGQTGEGKFTAPNKKSLKNCFNYLNECNADVRYQGLSHDYFYKTGTIPVQNWDSFVSCH